MLKSIMSGVALAGAAALLSTSAMADGPYEGSPRSYNWTGFYVGATAGYAWGNSDASSSFTCPGGPGTCAYEEPAALGLFSGLASGSINSDGFIGGVHAGYQSQHGKFVGGLEVDFSGLDLSSSIGGRDVPVPNGDPLKADVSSSISTDWLLTFRQRVGYTITPNVLVYATGGLAVARVNVDNEFFSDNADPGLVVSGGSSHSQVRAGWTVGAGLEWALGGNWTVKGEYLYVDLGSVSTKGTTDLGVGGFPNSFDTSTTDLTTHIGRVGLSYKF